MCLQVFCPQYGHSKVSSGPNRAKPVPSLGCCTTMCSQEVQSSFMVLSCPVPCFVSPPGESTGTRVVMCHPETEEWWVRLCWSSVFQAEAPWSQETALSYFTSGAVSGREISGSSHLLTAHSTGWSQVSLLEHSGLYF